MPDGSKIGGSTDPKRRHPDSESAHPAPAAKRARPQSPEVIDLTGASKAKPPPSCIPQESGDSYRNPSSALKNKSSIQPAQIEQSTAHKMAALKSYLDETTYKRIVNINKLAPLTSGYLDTLIHYAKLDPLYRPRCNIRRNIEPLALRTTYSLLRSRSGASRKTKATFVSKHFLHLIRSEKRSGLTQHTLSKPFNPLQEQLITDVRFDKLIKDSFLGLAKYNIIETLLSVLHHPNNTLYQFLSVNADNINALFKRIYHKNDTKSLDLYLAIGIKATKDNDDKRFDLISLIEKSPETLFEDIFQSIRQSDDATILELIASTKEAEDPFYLVGSGFLTHLISSIHLYNKKSLTKINIDSKSNKSSFARTTLITLIKEFYVMGKELRHHRTYNYNLWITFIHTHPHLAKNIFKNEKLLPIILEHEKQSLDLYYRKHSYLLFKIHPMNHDTLSNAEKFISELLITKNILNDNRLEDTHLDDAFLSDITFDLLSKYCKNDERLDHLRFVHNTFVSYIQKFPYKNNQNQKNAFKAALNNLATYINQNQFSETEFSLKEKAMIDAIVNTLTIPSSSDQHEAPTPPLNNAPMKFDGNNPPTENTNTETPPNPPIHITTHRDTELKWEDSKPAARPTARQPQTSIAQWRHPLQTGINPRYVLGLEHTRTYRTHKKAEYEQKRGFTDQSIESATTQLWNSQRPLSFTGIDALGGLQALPKLDSSNEHYINATVDLTPDVKRSYVQSDSIQVLLPKGTNSHHLNFVIAGRTPDAVRWPDPARFAKQRAKLTNVLVLTKQQLEEEWDNRIPHGIGVVILPKDSDTTPNCRRNAAIAALDWAIQQDPSPPSWTLQDDSVEETSGFEEMLLKMLQPEHEHTIFSMINRTQKKPDPFCSGKLIGGRTKLITAFKQQNANQLALLFPPLDLYFEDIWFNHMLSNQTSDVNSKSEIGGLLRKHRLNPNLAYQCYSGPNNHQPVDSWINAQPENINFIDETVDRAFFNACKQHLTESALKIRAKARGYRNPNKPLEQSTALQLQAKRTRLTTEAPFSFELRDYQEFLTRHIEEGILHAQDRGETKSHVALMQATGTGKTYTFLQLVENYLSQPSTTKKPKRCLILTKQLDNSNDIFDKAQIFNTLKTQTIKMSSDVNAVGNASIVKAPDDNKPYALISVDQSLSLALQADEHFLDQFDIIVFDEAHRYAPAFMEQFQKLSDKQDGRHRTFIQASATPNMTQLEPGYLGESLFVANYTIETALRRKEVRPVIYENRDRITHEGVQANTVLRTLESLSPDNKAPLLCNVSKRRLDQHCDTYPALKEKNKQVILWVNSAEEANACANYINQHPEAFKDSEAWPYHSSGIEPAKRKQYLDAFIHTNQASTDGESKPKTHYLIAVRMGKEASDIPGSDVLINLSSHSLTPTQRSQWIGRAYRHSSNGLIPALFIDYSYLKPNDIAHYKDTPSYAEYDYEADTIALLVEKRTGGFKRKRCLRDDGTEEEEE